MISRDVVAVTVRTDDRTGHKRALIEIFEDLLRFEARVEHNAVVSAGEMRNIGILVEGGGNDSPNDQFGFRHRKCPFRRKMHVVYDIHTNWERMETCRRVAERCNGMLVADILPLHCDEDCTNLRIPRRVSKDSDNIAPKPT